MQTEAWATDDDLKAARLRFAEHIPGYRQPAAYTVARIDDGELSFGHFNDVGDFHWLPAAVLATVCGYSSGTATIRLTAEQMHTAVELLSPAEAATHVGHPNLWSWRKLLAGADEDAEFVAFFVGG